MKMPPLEDLILPAISCTVDISQGTRGGIRIRMLRDVLEVELRTPDGGVSYDKLCTREVIKEEAYMPYVAMIASNS